MAQNTLSPPTAPVQSTASDSISQRNDSVCSICKKQVSKYTCPRCNLMYCSLQCYKANIHRYCTESFYQDNYLQELKNLRVSEDQAKKMRQILSKVEMSAVEEDQKLDFMEEERNDFASRLEGLDLETADVQDILSVLTAEERQEFESQFQIPLQESPLINLIPIWVPWWKYVKPENNTPLVSEVQSENGSFVSLSKIDENADVRSERPEILKGIPNLKDVSNNPPHENLCFNLIEILFAYSAASRYFNGEIHEFTHDAAQMLSTLSWVLSSSEPLAYDSVSSTVAACMTHATNNPSYFTSRSAFTLLLSDTYDQLRNPQVTLSSLSDIYRLFETASTTNAPNYAVMTPSRKRECHRFKKTAFRISKKVWWYCSWCLWVSQPLEGGRKGENEKRKGYILFEILKSALTLEIQHWEKEFETINEGKRNLTASLEKEGKKEADAESFLIQEM